MRITLGEASQQIYASIVPSLDNQANIDRFNSYINLAQERLINSGKWNGTILPVRFYSPSGMITLPRRFVSALAAKWNKNTGTDSWASGPIKIRNGWFSYLNPISDLWTASYWPRYGYNETFFDDLGDGFATFANTTYETYTLKFEIENAGDAGKSVVVKGKDANDNDVTLEIVLSNPSVTTTQVFRGQMSFFSKPITLGSINLYAVSGTDQEKIGDYEASETTASYHRYAVPNEPSVDYLDVLCKIRFVPCVYDTDEVIVSNLGALKNMLMSLKWEDEGDMERSEMFFMKAIQLLNGESREVRGGSQWRLNIDRAAMQFENLWPGR
jgi:hypothetical protein